MSTISFEDWFKTQPKQVQDNRDVAYLCWLSFDKQMTELFYQVRHGEDIGKEKALNVFNTKILLDIATNSIEGDYCKIDENKHIKGIQELQEKLKVV